MRSCFSLSLKLFTFASNLVVDGDSLTGEGIHSGGDVDDDDDIVLMLPSSQLAELDQAYKSGGQDAVRQLLQSQSMEQVYQQSIPIASSPAWPYSQLSSQYYLLISNSARGICPGNGATVDLLAIDTCDVMLFLSIFSE